MDYDDTDDQDAIVPDVNFLTDNGDPSNNVIRERINQQADPVNFMGNYNPRAPIYTEYMLDIQEEEEDFDIDGSGVTRLVFSKYLRRWCQLKRIRNLSTFSAEEESFRHDIRHSLEPPIAELVLEADAQRNAERGVKNTDQLQYGVEEEVRLKPHPNIVSLIGFISPSQIRSDIKGVLTEAASHGTVEYYMKHDNLVDDNLLLRWTYQLAQALAYCHGDPFHIIHRDINPAHVYVFDDGKTVKLGDFFYSVVSRDNRNKLTANKSDRLPFCAPEVLSASEMTCYSFSADIWSLAMLIEPYDKTQFANGTRFKKQIYEGLRPNLRPDLNVVVKDVIEACWRNEKRGDDGSVLPLEALRPTANQVARHLESNVVCLIP